MIAREIIADRPGPDKPAAAPDRSPPGGPTRPRLSRIPALPAPDPDPDPPLDPTPAGAQSPGAIDPEGGIPPGNMRRCGQAAREREGVPTDMAMTVPKGLLDGHVAVVTGGGSGIGRGTALAMAEAGARVAVVDRNEEGANETVSLIGNAASAYRTDVTDRDACRDLAARVLADFGPASILFNNAGIVRRAKIDSPTAAQDWQDTIDVNVNGLFNVTHAFLDQLKETRGRIVSTGSLQSFVHTPNSVVYTTSKGAVKNFTTGLAAELAPHGIRVNAVAPGLIFTPLNEEGIQKNPELLSRFMQHIPLGRHGTPEDIAGAVLFLASDLAQYVTGVTLAVDGGYLTV